MVDIPMPAPGRSVEGPSPLERRVLEAALDAIRADGYHAGSFAHVAALSGLTLDQLLEMYPDERVLLVDAMRYRDALGASGIPDAHVDGRGLLQAFLDIVRYNAATPGAVELFTILVAASTSPEHPGHEYFRERYTWLRGMVEDALEELEQEGELRRRARPAMVAAQTLALLDGLQVQWLLDRGVLDMESHVRDFLNLHLHRPLEPGMAPRELAR